MNKTLRTILMVLGVLVLAALLFGFGYRLYWMAAGGATSGFGPMMGGRWLGTGGGMMSGRWLMHGGAWMGLFPIVGWILGLGILALAVFGLVSLVRRPASGQPARVCAHCGVPLEAGWIACPRCGEKV